ncbi:MAG TPA: EamA family transporter, partial [Ilumatobacteraceae bacterium]
MTAPAAAQPAAGAEEISAAEQKSGLVWGISAYVYWGLVTIYWKHLEHFNAFEIVGFRITMSCIVMVIVAAATGRLRPLLARLRDRALLGRVAFPAVMLTANWVTYVWAVGHGRVLETALGYFITPIGLMLAGVLVLHETMRRMQQVALGARSDRGRRAHRQLRPRSMGRAPDRRHMGDVHVRQEAITTVPRRQPHRGDARVGRPGARGRDREQHVRRQRLSHREWNLV